MSTWEPWTARYRGEIGEIACRRCGGIGSHADCCEHAEDTRFDAMELPGREPDALPRRLVEQQGRE
jgi:hypothetical protein